MEPQAKQGIAIDWPHALEIGPMRICVQKKKNQVNLIVSIYVDDFLIIWKQANERDRIKRLLCEQFKMKDMGTASTCVGLKIIRYRDGSYSIDQQT